MNKKMEQLGNVAQRCAFGERTSAAYISSKFFSGGFAFNTVQQAAAWVDTQRTRNLNIDGGVDFHAAVVDNGVVVSYYG